MARTATCARIVRDDPNPPAGDPDSEVDMAVQEELAVPNVSPTRRHVQVFCFITICWSQFSSSRANLADA